MKILFTTFSLCFGTFLFAQNDKDINLQNYTPSSLLKEKQVEIKVFNNLYSDNSGFNAQRKVIKSNRRQTYFTSFVQSSYGIGKRWNFGIDAQVKSVRLDNDRNSSALELFTSHPTANTRTALSYIGPKIKISPFKKIEGFSIQSTFFFPVAKDQQGIENGKPWLSHDGYQWWTQLYYDLKLSSKFRSFFEVDAFASLDRKFNKANHSILTPAKGFLSYFPTKKITVYGLAEIGPSWNDGKINSYYTQLGLGAKYQLVKNLEIEVLYTRFPVGKNSGKGTTLNLGVRFLK